MQPGGCQYEKPAKYIEIKAPVSRVWRALTDYREFGEWFRVNRLPADRGPEAQRMNDGGWRRQKNTSNHVAARS